MGIFGNLGRKLGFGGSSDPQAQRRLDAAKARARNAQIEAEKARKLAEKMMSEASRRDAERLGKQRELEARVQEELKRERRMREEMRKQEDLAKKIKDNQERVQHEMRDFLLKSNPPYTQRAQEGASGYYANLKGIGKGDMPFLKEFLLGHPYSRFASSNVKTLQYDPTKEHLYIEYLRRRGKTEWYRYHDCDKYFAEQFLYAASKGIRVWDTLRIRGSGSSRMSRKSFTKGSPPSYLPIPVAIPVARPAP